MITIGISESQVKHEYIEISINGYLGFQRIMNKLDEVCNSMKMEIMYVLI